MGQTASAIASKVKQQWVAPSNSDDSNQLRTAPSHEVSSALARWKDPYLYTKTVNLYKDRDGWVANEFYEQKRVVYKKGTKKRSKMVMKKVPCSELQSVSELKRSHPAFKSDFPVILCEKTVLPDPSNRSRTTKRRCPQSN